MATKKGKTGTSADDILSGTDKADTIFGRGGNDIIASGDGNDKIKGGKGDDTIDGGAGNDKIHGGKGNDTIFGGAGNDKMKGGSGDDLITGGAGADKLTGGSGNDHFIYLASSDSPAESGWDRITDFTQGQDKIDLAALLGSTDLAWGDTTATANGAWYENSGPSTFVYADTDGDGAADLKIELSDTLGLNLTVDDFIGVSDAPQVNTAPVAVADNVITGVSPGDSLFIPEWALLANDSDPDGDSLSVTDVSLVTTDDFLVWPSATQPGSVELIDLTEFDASSFTYMATDGEFSSTAIVNVTQDLDGVIDGTPGNDILVGATFEPTTLIGNGGNDVIIGGIFSDVFKYSFTPSPAVTSADGFDTIVNFDFAGDQLEFNGLGAGFTLAQFQTLFDATEADVNGDAITDTVLALTDNSWSVTLLGVSGHTEADFHAASVFS